MFWYLSKELREKRTVMLYKIGRKKVAFRSGLIFAFGYLILSILLDYFTLESFQINDIFIKENVIHFILNLVLWSFVGYHLNWSMIEEGYFDYKDKQNE